MTQFLGAQIDQVPNWLLLPYDELEYIIQKKIEHTTPKKPHEKGTTWTANESDEMKFLRQNLPLDKYKELKTY